MRNLYQTNEYAGICYHCGQPIGAKEGQLFATKGINQERTKTSLQWRVKHKRNKCPKVSRKEGV